MESYLKNTLGLHVEINAWNDSYTLPDELRRGREFLLLTIVGIQCLVIMEYTSDFQISSFLKEQELLLQYSTLPKVLCFERINSYQRKCLIESGVNFIVPENQIFMPFLGIALQEHFKAQPVASTQLTAMAQYILLYVLYDKTEQYHSKLDISKELEINLMNVSRGVAELEELGLLETRKKGRSSMLISDLTPKELYKKAFEYLRDPIQRRMFVKAEDWLLELPVAGKEAAHIIQPFDDILDSPPYRTRAMEKRVFLDNQDRIKVVDPAWEKNVDYIELEVWRYDPARFTDGKIVDSISLSLSIMGEVDIEKRVNIDKLLG